MKNTWRKSIGRRGCIVATAILLSLAGAGILATTPARPTAGFRRRCWGFVRDSATTVQPNGVAGPDY